MGKNFCICNDGANHENESNMFSIMPNNKPLEKDTIKTIKTFNSENTINQNNSVNKTYQDDNYALNTLLNKVYKKNNNNISDNSKLRSEINKNDNFQCSGKFNILNISTNNHPPYEENDNYNQNNNSMNVKESQKINNTTNKNEFGFTSFKSFFDNNNNNKSGVEKENKDNNTNQSKNLKFEQSLGKYKNITINGNSQDINKSNDYSKDKRNKELKLENNGFSICRDNANNSALKNKDNNYSENRYNDISQYSDDVNDNNYEDYLFNESNYYNSNQREENRNNQSLFDEQNENT